MELQLSPFALKFSVVRLTESLAKTIPLIMTGLSVAIAFRAGFFNIGAEGQFLLGLWHQPGSVPNSVCPFPLCCWAASLPEHSGR